MGTRGEESLLYIKNREWKPMHKKGKNPGVTGTQQNQTTVRKNITELQSEIWKVQRIQHKNVEGGDKLFLGIIDNEKA